MMSKNKTTIAYSSNLVVSDDGITDIGVVIHGISGYNSKASAQFIQLHNAASLPADTAVPEVIITVGANSNFSIDFGATGRQFQLGCVICNSSTGPTKTIGSADCWFDAQYV